MSEHRLTTPLSCEDTARLRLGDIVYLTGEVVATAGYPTHERLMECVARGAAPPVDLTGAAFYHLGSCSVDTPDGPRTEYVNPTTSTRFNAFMPTLIRHFGLTAVAGKGGMDAACVAALRQAGAVYFSLIGGAAPLLTRGIEGVVETGWDDLITQFRLTRFKVRDFGPLTVAIDHHGNSRYADLTEAAAGNLPQIKRWLSETRGKGG